jgi:hypothetical protein
MDSHKVDTSRADNALLALLQYAKSSHAAQRQAKATAMTLLRVIQRPLVQPDDPKARRLSAPAVRRLFSPDTSEAGRLVMNLLAESGFRLDMEVGVYELPERSQAPTSWALLAGIVHALDMWLSELSMLISVFYLRCSCIV